ncbi:MAG: PQQ-binding-like beta-propeller repeat protein [Acidobacteria bacterium]|nr:PQQ-binding-like beta-propeller repeat protein [Acidobacteriota bacterium]
MLEHSGRGFPRRRSSSAAGACTAAFLALLLSLPWALAENWPQWRGPSSSGVSGSSGLPTHWNAEEHVKWKASLAGLGASSPIVWGDRIFVTSQQGRIRLQQGTYPLLARDDRELSGRENPIGGREANPDAEDGAVYLIVESFRLADGKRLWEFKTPATGMLPELHEKHNLATPTPVTDGTLVYAWFGNGQIFALDMEGRVAWKRHLGEEYSPFTTRWGHGSSPALHGDSLFLLCDHSGDSYLLALDKRTGAERWKADRGKEWISHSTPLAIRSAGGEELIINSSERIDAYDPGTGKPLWHAGAWRQTPVPTPVFHDGILYMVRGYRNSDFLAIRPGGRGDVTGTGILWRSSGGASYVPSILYYEGLLYVTNEVGVVTCADAADGKTLWRKRLGGIFFASPVAGDGKVYMVSETGDTYVLEAGREPNVLSQNPLDERMVASPAISGGNLILRSDGTLFCIGK